LETVRIVVILVAMVFFFFVLSGSFQIGGVDTKDPWAPIARIMIFAGMGIFFLFFAFVLTRMGAAG